MPRQLQRKPPRFPIFIALVSILLLGLSRSCSAQGLDISTVSIGNETKIQLGIEEASILDFLARKGLAAENLLAINADYIQQLYNRIVVQDSISIHMQRQIFDLQQVSIETQAFATLCQRDLLAKNSETFQLELDKIELQKDVKKYKAQSTNTRTFTKILVAVVAVLTVDRLIAK